MNNNQNSLNLDIGNEEMAISKIMEKEVFNELKGKVIDIIAGDFFICYAPPDNSELSSLPDELIQKYTEVFKTPQAFIDIGGKMLVVPVDE